MPFLFARRPAPGKNALTHTKPAAFLGCALCHLRRGAIRPFFLAAGLYFLEGALAEHAEDCSVLREQRRKTGNEGKPCVSVCCCIFPKGEQNFLAAKRPCGQFADSFADSHEKGVTSFDVTPCNLWSQHADLNRGPTDYEKTGFLKKLWNT